MEVIQTENISTWGGGVALIEPPSFRFMPNVLPLEVLRTGDIYFLSYSLNADSCGIHISVCKVNIETLTVHRQHERRLLRKCQGF